ncbi:MAG: LysM peptidoglycan-binding domain-containing protein [Clostridia bacterium]|nr:LysM peptidoglycan-binding domain-containing protein [Clostridia bacterium]
MKQSRKPIRISLLALLFALLLALPAAAATVDHTVVPGDTMWKTAVRYRVGLDEIIAANPQIKDPHWIYPGDVLHVPLPDDSVSAYEREVVELVNAIRAERGLGKLEENWELSRVARFKSRDMREKHYFAHVSPTYGSPFEMMRAFGLAYRTAGENIAMGYPTPASVVDGWMNSEGHRANILNPSFTVIGVGYVAQGNYWTQMFIG